MVHTRGMTIRNVRVLRVEASKKAGTNWTFVRIETDQGIHGVGEASLQYKDDALVAEIQGFGRFLEGQDPSRIEQIWTSLHRRVTWTGGPVTISAISAIDMALWDIKARSLGVPVYELIGGRVHDTIPAYANGWTSGARTPEEYAERTKEVVDRGYAALKVYPFIGPQVANAARIRSGINVVRAIREAVGPDMEIGVDVRGRLNFAGALRASRALEEIDVAWLEEPILFDNVETMAELARRTRIPVSTGEQLYTRWEFQPLLQSNAVGIIQPDLCHAGGISELKKIASAAETHYVTVAPHNSNGPISTVASLHLDATLPNLFMQEIFLDFLEAYGELLTEPLVIRDGFFELPQGPGWGTDLDLDAVAARPPVPYTPVVSEPYLAF